jgi:hypothetical protein
VIRCYIAATGIVFGLIFAAHIARLFAEGSWLLREPFFIGTTIASLALGVWALVLLTKRPR